MYNYKNRRRLQSKIGTKKSTDISLKIVGFILIIGGLVMLYFVLSGKLVLPLSKDYQEENTSEAEISVIQEEEPFPVEMPENLSINAVNTDVSQGGPYGEISIALPDGWSYELCPIDSDHLVNGVYGIHLNGEWEEAPIPIEGNYGFNDIAIMLPCGEISEREIDWEWIYGKLEPGEYRIGKSVDDFIESGNYDEYMVYAHFVLN